MIILVRCLFGLKKSTSIYIQETWHVSPYRYFIRITEHATSGPLGSIGRYGRPQTVVSIAERGQLTGQNFRLNPL